MSTLSMASPAPVRSTRLRLTVRGRRLLALIAALPAAVALCMAMLAGGSALASGAAGAPAPAFETVTVASGDSLWGIAADIAPGADPRDVVDAIVRLNALDGPIVPGQQLALPAEFSR
ncbi:MAG: LysM peptidoglycan-binding domain-containing protein [Chloroflexota bacterium]|nr:LysM peptidoglycan-binding domain-containing protein [Chloroflexota bacterium]